MIRSVRLTGWKAFDALTFEPGPGVTFAIARNGVGKTSLLDGIAWGTFGDRSGVDADAIVRVGHSAARATVQLDGPDDEVLRIERSTSEATRASLGDAELSVDELDGVLRKVFGANLDFAARAVALGHQALWEQTRSFAHLDAHLADVFGIAQLRDATETMEARFAQLKSANQKLRTATKPRPDVGALRARAETIASEVQVLSTQRPALQEAFDTASSAAGATQEAARAAQRLADWRHAAADLDARGTRLLGEGAGSIGERLAVAIAAQEEQASAAAEAVGSADATYQLAHASLTSLTQPGAICPTCRRPLADHERADARSSHSEIADAALVAATAAREQVDQLTRRLSDLRDLARDVERLGVAPPEPAVVDAATSTGTFEEARDALGALERQIGERQGALGEIERAIASYAADAQADAERHAAIRREALAQLASGVMRGTVDELMRERVAPIADEVSARWKQVFGDRGSLRLSPDGEISMERVGELIPFQSFSPGEQVVAMLALRFLTVAASTTSPFMLLDEPLECLDPPNRRLIASVLVGEDRPVQQMIVTTYEESLVRRIHATVPGIDVRVIG